MIALIGAMPEEVANIKEKIENLKERKIAHVTFYEGIYEQRSIVLMLSLPGKVNAAIATTLLLDHYKPEYVINIGTCGALQGSMEIGDMIVATEVRHFDVDATEFGYELGQVPQMPESYPVDSELKESVVCILQERITEFGIHSGFIATSDSFMSSVETVQNIREHLPDIVASDMESTPLAQVAHFYDIPVLNIRGISDHVGGEAPDTFEATLELASKHAFEAVCTLVEEL